MTEPQVRGQPACLWVKRVEVEFPEGDPVARCALGVDGALVLPENADTMYAFLVRSMDAWYFGRSTPPVEWQPVTG
ncbi:MAG: hypothetical protein VX346_25365 [Planctomycetota bacterium]|nr:hypothetical protein [Planctomycetota bacterium]